MDASAWADHKVSSAESVGRLLLPGVVAVLCELLNVYRRNTYFYTYSYTRISKELSALF